MGTVKKKFRWLRLGAAARSVVAFLLVGCQASTSGAPAGQAGPPYAGAPPPAYGPPGSPPYAPQPPFGQPPQGPGAPLPQGPARPLLAPLVGTNAFQQELRGVL